MKKMFLFTIRLNCLVIICQVLTGLILTSCQAPAKQSDREAFQELDNSLFTDNRTLRHSILLLHTSATRNPAKADRILFLFAKADRLIDSIQNVIILQDTTGTSLQIAGQVLVQSPTGEHLRQQMLELADYTSSLLPEPKSGDHPEQSFGEITTLRDRENGMAFYFSNTPTVAAVTMLDKFSNDCMRMAMMGLQQLQP